ncbi:MAG TPA: NlpC/P60 family protein [Bacillota bacterium]|nr:NlpC/P60 family protein [Bacillota bacterium]HPE37989.1 NlpC/P60 family protein [Bacillota bacterium]
MRKHITYKKNKNMAVLSIAVCAVVTLPLLLLPVGLRESTPAGVLVGRAYAATYPTTDQEEVLIEDWALSADELSSEQPVSETDPSVDPSTDPSTDPSVDPSIDPSADPTVEVPDETADGYPEGQEPEINPDSGLIVLTEGSTIEESYLEGMGPTEESNTYDGILTATVMQTYDSSNLPIELLDPTTFISDNTTYYIRSTDSIIKETPNMDSRTLASIARGKEVVRIGIGDTWSKIRTEEGVEGYVLSASITPEMVFIPIDRTVWVDTSGLKLRSAPNTDCEVVRTLSKYTRLHCVATADKWYQVTTDDGEEGYVYISYTTQSPPPTPSPTPVRRTTSSTSGGRTGNTASLPVISGRNGESIVNIAKSMLGVDYVWCGESTSGVDCSGLVVYCYRQIGISVAHQSNSQRYLGVGIARSDIALGDVIVYDLKGGDGIADHVAIYAGGGQVIHASSSRDCVCYGSLDMGTILTIRRFIG